MSGDLGLGVGNDHAILPRKGRARPHSVVGTDSFEPFTPELLALRSGSGRGRGAGAFLRGGSRSVAQSSGVCRSVALCTAVLVAYKLTTQHLNAPDASQDRPGTVLGSASGTFDQTLHTAGASRLWSKPVA
eukprot:6212669-Pleurochrysis_carterae.AAC.3